MSADEAMQRGRADGFRDLGAYSAADLAAVGFPVASRSKPAAAEIAEARKSLVVRGLVDAGPRGTGREPAGDLATSQELNGRTRAVLVCGAGIGQGSAECRLQALVLADVTGTGPGPLA